MARIRIPLQARRCHARPAVEHPASAAPRLADVVGSARQATAPTLVLACPRTVAGERADGDGAACEQSLRRQAASLRARAVLRLHFCRKRGKGGRPMVGPPIAWTIFSRRASESATRPITRANPNVA